MPVISTSPGLQEAVEDAKSTVLELVEAGPGSSLAKLYGELTGAGWYAEPVARAAIWDLMAMREIVVRRGNLVYLSSTPGTGSNAAAASSHSV